MAVTIVPAVNVSSWNILPGYNPFSRFVIVDVANETDLDAELTFGAENRRLTVQPKEICRCVLWTMANAYLICKRFLIRLFLFFVFPNYPPLPSVNGSVPLLCPCCDGIPSAAFQRAAKQASHMMQMQEIERLRRKMETHLTKHLEIRWVIARLRVRPNISMPFLNQWKTDSFSWTVKCPSVRCSLLSLSCAVWLCPA